MQKQCHLHLWQQLDARSLSDDGCGLGHRGSLLLVMNHLPFMYLPSPAVLAFLTGVN
eukprot:m.26820 g.26820  ORF g.26820 m.26820 type:complete len:57 (-) comp11717_c0_seq1:25-195(-)